jgi:DNA-binding transcriptional regulator YhcF (GntR family)
MNERYTKVKENPHLRRDTRSGAIVNVNTEAWKRHMKDKETSQSLENVIRENKELKNEIEEIKRLLLSLAINK